MTLLGIVIASIWYLVLACYGIAVGLLPAQGLSSFQYGLLVLIFQIPLMFLALIPFVATLMVTEFMPRTAGVLNGVSLGTLAVCVMLPIHLFLGPETDPTRNFATDALAQLGLLTAAWVLSIDLLRLVLVKVSRRVSPPAICAANAAFVLAVAGLLYVGLMIVLGQPAALARLSGEPADAAGRIMLFALLAGLFLTLIFEVPRALLGRSARQKAWESPRGESLSETGVRGWRKRARTGRREVLEAVRRN